MGIISNNNSLFKSAMNIVNKFQDEYQKLWQYIIRPERTTYPQTSLGPEVFTLQNIKVKRNSFQLINSRGLIIYGSHFVPMQQSQYPCLIYLHGNSSNQIQGIQYLSELIRNGISLCTFDFSGCGNAEGDYVTLGFYEWMDVEEVYMHVKSKEQVSDIGIWGRSMGAVAALRFLNNNKEIKVAVFDSPFSSLEALVLELTKNNTKIPKIIASGALKIINTTIKEKAKFDIYDLNPLKNEAPFINVPAFFIAAEQDEMVPPKQTKLVFDAYKCPKKQIRVVSGNHNSNRPEATISQIVSYLSKYLKRTQKKAQKLNAKKQDVKQIDFFNEDFDESANQGSEIPTETKQKLEEIDFFSKQEQQMQNNNTDQFDLNEFTKAAETTNQNQPGFSLNNIFTGMFTSKSKQKVKKNDGYEELRVKLDALNKQISHQNKSDKEFQERVKQISKQSKDHDISFERLLIENANSFVWAG